jgi:prepilin-type N-terminal cleavage/methylation domain-containing protein
MKLRSRSRAGFTLLEILLALGIAVVLMAGVYSGVMMHYRQIDAGREVAEDAQVLRALVARMRADLQAIEFRWAAPKAPTTDTGESGAAGGASGAAGGASGAAGATGGSGGAAAGASGGATAGTAGGATGGAASGTGAAPATTTTEEPEEDPSGFPPGGVMGTSQSLTLLVRTPPEGLDLSTNVSSGTAPSLLRMITYSLGRTDNSSFEQGEGLLRRVGQETPSTTVSYDPNAGVSELLAPEVKKIQFSFYDGTEWTEYWDTTRTTPPVAIKVELAVELRRPGANNDGAGLAVVRFIHTVPGTDLSSNGSSTSGS